MKLAAVLAFTLFLGCVLAYPQTETQPTQNQPAQANASSAAPHIDPAKEADIRHLLDLTGTGSLMVQSMNEMEKSIRPLVSNSLPPGEYREKLVDLFFEKFRAKRDAGQLLALIIPIYDKYYTAAEIKGLIQFYGTPLGKKMASVLPNIMSESQAVGGKWGEQLGRDSMMEVLEEHPELRKALEDAKANQQPQ
jgi:uncharacterized protein